MKFRNSKIKKKRAPGRIGFYKGLGHEALRGPRLLVGQPSGLCEVERSDEKPDRDAIGSERADGESRLESIGDCRHKGDFAQ